MRAALMMVAMAMTAASAAQGSRSVWDGVYTEAQAARGADVYAQRCANCHGEGLGGIEAAPALTGIVFMSTWEGVPLGDLAERIRLSMPLDNPSSLSRQQTADLLAHMLAVGRFPAGGVELPPDTSALGQITLTGARR